MKVFMITSIIAMVTAGVYGTIDLANDIKNDRYIQYEEDIAGETSNTASVNNFTHVLRKARHEISEASEEKKKKKDLFDLDEKYFSRSSPVLYDEMYLTEIAALDSAKIKADTAIATTTALVSPEKTKEKRDTVLAKEAEDKKLGIRLFSRGKPRPYKKPQTPVVSDTLGAVKKEDPK
ncbi:MAG TPA: hypothetical protein VNY73_03245 [Bacteroidia bacterium]|jgi:hypothetical protein|nr:hypothetical protein [Bacteroidia bacterium]